MSNPPLSDKDLKLVANAFQKTGSKVEGAKLLNLHPNTFTSRLKVAQMRGFVDNIKATSEEMNVINKLAEAQDRIKQLESMAFSEQ